jgi:outer membrane biosynthesis protein TonB
MAQQSSDSKILRIGVIQSGKVIEERLVRKRTTVTFGTDGKNTFIFPGGKDTSGKESEKSWALFELKGNQYFLVFSDDMDGRVSVENNNVDFASLKAQNLVQKQGDRYRLPLNDSSRGRVQFGSDLTILFHFVAAPPVAAKPELPLAARGGWVKSIEPVFTGVLTGSFIIHAIMTLIVFNVDQPPPPSLEDVKALMARVAPPKVEVPPAPPPDMPSTPDDSSKGPKEDEEKKDPGGEEPKGPKQKGSPGDAAKAAADRRADVQSKIAGKGLLGLIGAKGDGAGALADVFGSGSALGNLSTDVSGTGGIGIAGSGSDVTRRGEGGGGGGGGAADIGSLGAGGGGALSTGTKQVAKIQPSVKADAIGELDGAIDKKGVGRALRARAQAFQQCYESALKTNSKLKGKLVVEFTISESGSVADVRVLNDGLGSPEVASCVIAALKRIRFPKPDDGEVTISNSFVFQPGG